MKEEFLQFIQQADDLPTPSSSAIQVMKKALDEDVSLTELANDISNDASLSTRILKVVNSPYYGLPRKVATIKQAVVILGIQVVRNLALAVSVVNVFEKGENSHLYNKLMESSLCSAVAAHLIGTLAGMKTVEEAFVVGLLENIGMFLMMHYAPEIYGEVFEEAEERGIDIVTAEEEILGINHAQVGNLLALRWGLPESIVLSIRYHHSPRKLDTKAMPEDLLNICKIAYISGLVSEIFYGWGKSGKIMIFKKELSESFNLNNEAADDVLSRIDKKIVEAANGFHLTGITSSNYTQILNEANVELGRMNIKYDMMYKELNTAADKLKEKMMSWIP